MTDHLRDVVRAGERCGLSFTHFLDPATQLEFFAAARGAGLQHAGCGGCEDSERKVCAGWREGCAPECFPVSALRICWGRLAGQPGHRDILGALLGLGIARDRIGDIRMADGWAWLAVEEGIAAFVADNFREAGHVALRVEKAEEAPLLQPAQVHSVNVASLRLDAIIAAALDVSRASAQELVRTGRVWVNWRENLRPDRIVDSGDMLSIRGRGRVKVGETTGISRKGRVFVALEIF